MYVDDFVMLAPESLKEKMWRELDEDIKFKDPAIALERYLGVFFEVSVKEDGTVVLKTQMTHYLRDAVKAYMKELGATTLAFVPTPHLDEKFEDDPTKVVPGKFAKTCASHLMKLLYAARRARADFLVANITLARRVSKWFSDEDRRLHRLMCYVHHHAELALYHELHPDDLKTAVLQFYPDAELGGDLSTTKSTYGMWLEITSADGKRCWPLSWFCRKAGHSSGSTADSEVHALIGAGDSALKREVIPVLEQLERNLGRSVLLIGNEDNTQCISAIKRGYSPALRHLQRHCRTSLGFAHEVFYPDGSPGAAKYDSDLRYCETTKRKGDWMTKALDRAAFIKAREAAGYI